MLVYDHQPCYNGFQVGVANHVFVLPLFRYYYSRGHYNTDLHYFSLFIHPSIIHHLHRAGYHHIVNVDVEVYSYTQSRD